MGRKERRAREQRRENYATKHSAEKRKHTMITIGVLAVIGVIVGYSAWVFVNMGDTRPEGLEGAGALGSDHAHAALLVRVFDDKLDFSTPGYQQQSAWIHFEGGDGTTIHKHATGVSLSYLFESISVGLTDECMIFPDNRTFCSGSEYDLVFYINDEQVPDIREYEIVEGDRILISYGADSELLQEQIAELQSQEIIK